MNLTAREQDALDQIARTGGRLPGGRQNTQVTNRLINKGLVTAPTTHWAGPALTEAGRAATTVPADERATS